MVLVLVSCAGHAVAQEAPADANGYTLSHAYFPSTDGTDLHAWVWRPTAVTTEAKTPVLLFVGPYAGSNYRRSGGEMDPAPPSLAVGGRAFERGYTVVEVDLRGTGASAGCVDLGGPGEQADARSAVEWVAKQAWSNGRVGMGGGSYVGWTQFMAAADPPRALRAIAPVAALSNYYTDSQFANGVAHDSLQVGFAPTYFGVSYVPPGPEEGDRGLTNFVGSRGTRPGCSAEGIAPPVLGNDPNAPFYARRNLVPRLRKSKVPMFVTHGFNDWRVRPASLFDFFPTVTGQRRGWFGQWGHAGPSPRSGAAGLAGWMDQVMAFYDEHLMRTRPSRTDASRITVQEGHGMWRIESAWPPGDAEMTTNAIMPGSYNDTGHPVAIGPTTVDVLENQAEANELLEVDPERKDTNYWPVYGVGAWTVTEPFPHEAHLAGRVRLSVDVDVEQQAPLVALLYDIDGENNAWFITRSAKFVPADGHYTFDLMPQDWRVPSGHRLGVLLTNSDNNWYDTVNTNTVIHIKGGSFTVPFVRFARIPIPEGRSNTWIDAQLPIPVAAATVEASTVATSFPPPLVSGDCWRPPSERTSCPRGHR